MEIKIKPKPKAVKCQDSWEQKMQGVIFVKKESDIKKLWKVLCEQDDTWESNKHLIKVAPKEIEDIKDLRKYCYYCWKTDIYDVSKVKEKVDFIIYQYQESGCC